MPLVSDRCICLFKTEYSETSQILSLFSRTHGIIRTIAKGAHRRTKAGASRFDGGIDLLDLGDAVFTHEPARELFILTEWHLVDGHLAFRANLRATYLAMYAAELVARLIEEQDSHPLLFDRLQALLPELGSPRREEAFLNFQLSLLKDTGYTPEFSLCTSCGNTTFPENRIWFSPASGGIICRNCQTAIPDRTELNIRLWRLIQSFLRPPRTPAANGHRLPQLTRHQTDPLNRILADHIEYILSRPLRLRPYIL